MAINKSITMYSNELGGSQSWELEVPTSTPTFSVLSLSQSNLRVTVSSMYPVDIEYSLNGTTNWTVLVTGIGNGMFYDHSGLEASTTIYYRGRERNSKGLSNSYSSVYSGTTQSFNTSQVTIQGTGFGAGPSVYLHDRFSGLNTGDPLPLDSPSIGSWDSYETGSNREAPTVQVFDGVPCLAGRGLSNAALGRIMLFDPGIYWNEARIIYRVGVPDGRVFPGETVGRTFDGVGSIGSSCKFTWASYDSLGGVTNLPDMCLPSKPNSAGGLIFGGNATSNSIYVEPTTFDWRVRWDWNKLNRFDCYIKANQSDPIGTPGVARFSITTSQGTGVRQRTDKAIMALGGAGSYNNSQAFFRWLRIPGWNTNGNDAYNPQLLYGQVYVALGNNARASVEFGDSAVYSSCTKLYEVPPDSWTTTEIRVTPASYENLQYIHITTADGTLLPSVINPKYEG